MTGASLRRLLWLGLLLSGIGLLLAAVAIAENGRERLALVLTIDGAIGPASADYVTRGLATADDRGAELVILRMDTPGGLDQSMRDMIKAILASPVPVATYVWPSGARAASAGTYILYASHLAVMAPGTTLGAATPVQVGGGSSPLPFSDNDEEDGDAAGEDEESAAQDSEATRSRPARDDMSAKMIEDAAAYIRGLAELRGRNAEWAEKAVREAASLSAAEAAEINVVDFLARDLRELLDLADGEVVTMGDGSERSLAVADLVIEMEDPDWRSELLAVITNPNLALILMMIGIYGLIFEFSNPGAIYPGTVGAISLILALYSLAILPINYAGLGLILLGVALMVGEAFAPSFGALGIGGAIAFVIGAMILFDGDTPGLEISPWVIGLTTATSALLLIIVMRMAFKSHRRQVATGAEEMVGSSGSVLQWDGQKGRILIHGEHWQALSTTPLQPGQRVRVRRLRGLVLEVEPQEADRDNTAERE